MGMAVVKSGLSGNGAAERVRGPVLMRDRPRRDG
jgi:hypothetical protein